MKDKKQETNHKGELKQGQVLPRVNDDLSESSLQVWQALVRKLSGSWKQDFPLQINSKLQAQDIKREKL